MKLAPETSKHCNYVVKGENINGYYQFLKRILRSHRYTDKLPSLPREKRQTTRTPDTSLSRRYLCRDPRNNRRTCIWYSLTLKLKDIEQANKIKILPNKTIWRGHNVSADGIKEQRNKEKTDAINKLEPPTNTKTLNSFLGTIQYTAKGIPNHPWKPTT